ncbi:hypothetical protein DPMN_011278 [Dreissena polymorpha]|uniref:Uncharacterized protein n=1 Tax=Dreissena polymorpha TaxID=45954 RepID=A0A9D4N5T6_DREPO|nr:hypothetical protein DPMN_011278 [Dreissena polymorpha]
MTHNSPLKPHAGRLGGGLPRTGQCIGTSGISSNCFQPKYCATIFNIQNTRSVTNVSEISKMFIKRSV